MGDAIRLWDATSGRLLLQPLTFDSAREARFSPDGSIVVAVGYSGAKAWHTASGKPIRLPQGINEWLLSAAVTPDNSQLLAGGMSNSAHLWNLSATRQSVRPMDHDSPVEVVACSHDAQTVITGSSDRTIRFWSNGVETQLPIFLTGAAMSAVFSQDDSQLATVSSSNVVRVWDAKNTTAIPTFTLQ